jgi:hypothetical protein
MDVEAKTDQRDRPVDLVLATMKSEPGPPMTLGNAANAELRLIVWCRVCKRQVENVQMMVVPYFWRAKCACNLPISTIPSTISPSAKPTKPARTSR